MGTQCTGSQRHSPSAPHPLWASHLCCASETRLSETCEASGSRIERLFLPCELWKSKGTLSSSRALDCPPISRRSKDSSPSDDALLLAPGARITLSRSHKEMTFEGALRFIGYAARGEKANPRTTRGPRKPRSARVAPTTTHNEEPKKVTKHVVFAGIIFALS